MCTSAHRFQLLTNRVPFCTALFAVPRRQFRSMQNDAAVHIQPLVLWQCACAARDLPESAYRHIIACSECDRLATEIGEALDDLERVLSRRHGRITHS